MRLRELPAFAGSAYSATAVDARPVAWEDRAKHLDKLQKRKFQSKSGGRRFFDQGSELRHLTSCLRIRRLGVRVPSGAPAIKAVTSGNVGNGLHSFPQCTAVFHMVGPWCSDGAPLSICCFGVGLCRCVLTSAFPCRPVQIMVVVAAGRLSATVYFGQRCGSSPPGRRRDDLPTRPAHPADQVRRRALAPRSGI